MDWGEGILDANGCAVIQRGNEVPEPSLAESCGLFPMGRCGMSGKNRTTCCRTAMSMLRFHEDTDIGCMLPLIWEDEPIAFLHNLWSLGL